MTDTLARLERMPLLDLALTEEGSAVLVPLGTRTVRDALPSLRTMPEVMMHLGPWAVAPGGDVDEEASTEYGLARGYDQPECDDSEWAQSGRINDVPIGAPSWESDSFEGWIWYRTSVTIPDGAWGDGELTLGSPIEVRSVGWDAFWDGVRLTEELVSSPVLELTVPEHRLSPGRHSLAVRQRITRQEVVADRVQEREGWRRIDLFCLQGLTLGSGFEAIELSQAELCDNVVTVRDAAGRWQLDMRYEAYEEGVIKSSTLTRLTGGSVTLSDIDLADLTGEVDVVHSEGHFAGLAGGVVVAGADPATVAVRSPTGIAVRTWPGLVMGDTDSQALPDVLFAVDPAGDPRTPVRRLLTILGRAQRDVAIYDPYGWYQISHASETKIELDDQLVGQIRRVMEQGLRAGARFDFVSLDCGWNDPDDLSRFHPVSFPQGAASITELTRASGAHLMLWVSPSDGPRAFRHELGLANPGLEGCESDNPGLPWRLCPTAEPWKSTFRRSLLALVRDHGARGFKLDGTELFCRSNDHGHLPGIWSIYANVRTMQGTLDLVSAAGADYLMLYWGLRSPWWLRWASTVWERGYLVEAAAPSGRTAWTLRGSVMSSQDIGHTLDWWTIPPHQQDSLGVWISDTAWASHLGLAGWDDAVVMDAARGTRAVQLWGDLRALVAGHESARLSSVLNVLARREPQLAGRGRPVGVAASGIAAYGYAWTADGACWLVLSQPGDESEIVVSFEELGVAVGTLESVAVDYLTRGAQAEVELTEAGVIVRQSGGSVVGVYCANDPRSGRRDGSFATAGAVQIIPLTQEHDDDVPADLLVPAYVGRVPRLANWMAGDVGAVGYRPAMPSGTPAGDRRIGRRAYSWRVDLTATRAGRMAVVVRFTRDGSAWHHDLLHEICNLRVQVDGAAVEGEQFPSFRHEQAGSWSWVRWTAEVSAGDHQLRVDVSAVCPQQVTTSLDVWLR